MKKNYLAITIYTILTVIFMFYAFWGIIQFPVDLPKAFLGLGGACLTFYILVRYYLDNDDDDEWMQQL